MRVVTVTGSCPGQTVIVLSRSRQERLKEGGCGLLVAGFFGLIVVGITLAWVFSIEPQGWPPSSEPGAVWGWFWSKMDDPEDNGSILVFLGLIGVIGGIVVVFGSAFNPRQEWVMDIIQYSLRSYTHVAMFRWGSQTLSLMDAHTIWLARKYSGQVWAVEIGIANKDRVLAECRDEQAARLFAQTFSGFSGISLKEREAQVQDTDEE